MCGFNIILVLSVLGLFGASEGQILQFGQCNDNILLQANFNIDQFLGTWYEYSSTEHPLRGECSSIDFERVGEAVTVSHRTVRQNFLEEYFGTATVPTGTARMSLNLPTASLNPINFWVWLTDYSNFALIYNCENVGATQRRFYIWQLTRQPTTTEIILAFMNTTMINNIGVNTNDLVTVDHSEEACYQLPLISPGQPVILPGQCDENIPVMQNFSAADFLGVWHEIYSYHSDNALGNCNRAQYSSQDGIIVDVVNSQIINQTLLSIEGFATVVSNDSSARLNVVLEVFPGITAETELLILATDYVQWAISYTCNNLNNNQKRVFSWIVSRTRTLPPEAQAEVNAVVNSIIDLNYAYYQPADQTNSACFYIPEFIEGQTAVFGGQCDLNIPVQPNFVAGDYLGLWYDIESFPTPFQFGSCANAFYELGDDGVNVLNTQVLNQTLLTIEGLATLVGNEAKLVVSFPIEGTNLTTETDYWIISTDYSNYSLVYSCSNVNDYEQRITMWKLSRSKSLTPEAISAINDALTTQTVFDPRFFRDMDQSKEACFFFPEANGEPVVFPGQCDDEEVSVVQNINLNLFSGVWYEVEAYPKEFQPGVCIGHTFTIAGNTGFNLVSTSVADQLLEVTSSQMVLTNGTDGRFTITISNGTGLITIPYEIIATDYFDYALAYSCMDLENDFKAIYSWKLSRSKQLSTNAVAAISTAIANYTVLSEDYFVPIDQSNDGCFYFPDLAPGESVILPGQCDSEDDLPIMRNFDAAAYLGRWRLIESYPSRFQVGQCNQAEYSLADDGTVIVSNSEVFNQTLRTATGSGTLVLDANNQTIGKLLVTFPNSVNPFELYIFDTDYENYSLVYGCVNLDNNQRQVQSWKMSRTKTLTAESVAAINAVTSNVTVLNDRYYQDVDHSDEYCFYFPETDGSSTVIFPGQCDENINVVTSFDAVGYMGLWHDIERYPAPFQDGTCGNAFYELLDGPIVDVFNTQVLNQTLDTISGSAVLDRVDANDTSAKLLVTFPVGGSNMTTPYWVLATDYITYALVYSCSNLGTERRAVTGWKLSRSKSLSPNAITAINEVVSTIDVLDDRYFIRQDQTPEGCFYFPEPAPDVPVVFPGQCDDEEVSVVQNINLNLFSGVWYEVEAYPKEFQPGVCIDHTFTIASNTGFNLVSTSVADQLLEVTSSQMVLTNGTDGRFTITISNGTGLITIPYEIIATDYFDYALAYSCMDLENDFKAIYSWKLSRSKQLSTNAVAAISTAIANYTVLSEDYFVPIDQSNDGCFYFPDLAPGESVIFPGQCDSEDDLPIMRNFDAAAYLGRWRLIESYPSRFQVGQCNQAEYSLADDGTVIVSNSEVFNQTLRTATGSGTLVLDANNQTIGKLLVTFPNSVNPFELYIFDTDYENYSLVYGCVNLDNNQRQVQSWKMSRTKTLTAESVAAINAVTSNVTVLNDRYYQDVNHSDEYCFYFPETDGSSTVIFPGQCDENINVVTSFDAVGYMGLWHDIERYPAPFQDGTCGNAFYELLDGPVVDVFNTQVLNQTLDTISGSAVLDRVDANDTSAKLLVTFPVGGSNMTTPYWVLATDYITYALVYSCSNLGTERRAVTGWKLSRSKSLSPNAIAAINEVVSTIDVLDDRYFIRQDQTPEGCFYFPEPAPDVPVVFPGQCDDEEVSVVQNINLNLFSGVWYEVEAYPKEFQPGVCIDHTFTIASNTGFNLVSTSVADQLLEVTSSQMVLTNGTDGRFTLTISNGTDPITIPYEIIATDYFDYALAYSCMDLENDFKAIYSWKLSRSKQLSTNAVAAISTAIANYTVLSEDYFVPIDQSNDGCFYFPDLALGESVILPGQCDSEDDLPIMRNFDAAAYLGRWRLIESYPSRFQVGQCNQAEYSLADDGTVIVSNSEVFNQTLRTATGSGTLVLDANNQTIGKLLVTFPNSVNPFELYIFDTDYENYSLVYGCVNLENNQRQVQSWKMSRTKTLTAESVAAINAVTSNVTVLNDRYYQDVNHSDEYCFYFPETDGSSTVIFPGQCNENINVVTSFDAVGYMGLWHDIERYPAPFQDGTCGNAFYELLDGPVVDVFNTQVLNQTLDTISGSAVLDRVDANDTSAKLLVTFPVGGSNMTTPYWVLATDYNTYALVYSCSNLGTERRAVTGWKLSRSKSLSPNAIAAINEVVSTIDVLDDRYFILQDQTPEGCFYFPEPEPDVPVVFPGQCDVNAPVVQNFNFSAFSGIWHEVEAYPKEEQTGDCIRHEFTIGTANNLEFSSFNVIGESLGITSGTVRVTSNDNSAKLELVFVSNGTTITIPYWIVDTDYDNYAVVYSCVNQENGDFRGIWSWKLSRTRQLSVASSAAIDNAIADIDVLDNVYYVPISQTDESCFYYPVLSPGEAVVFPGQCDTNITGMANFDATRYLGLWRTIETYPSDFQLGDCGDATYSLNPNGTVDVFNTEVIDQTLSTINGVAELTDVTGKLLVYFPDTPFPSEYYVLTTDYDNYALVYSCFNINEDYRRVFSWKLSRTNSLSSQAEAEINRAMSQINVLDSRYYEAVNRTDESCFYFPEPDGNSVIFRGQCDESIDVVMAFDPVRYSGVWYDIESYPAPFQGGSCGTANYDLDLTTLIVAVENTQVVNPDGLGPVQDVQTGTAVLATNDTSAKLLVTFDVNGQIYTTDYWVLATDYINYALVYSCQNINDEYRQVNSWKLSRTRNITAESIASITAVIDSVQVLEERYFVEGGHSEEDCFFYPDNEGGDVILDGLCVPDAEVPAITGFNANLFAGTWHEVARFPSDLQEGECTVADYSIGTQNNIVITQTEVDNEFQTSNIIYGSLSADGRGVINAEISGIPFNTFFVLDTDYSEFALLYGCRNLANNTKQIYSWKFSRSRSGLSDNANNRIDTVVRNKVDLFENYYESTNQSNDACFHYPEFDELPAAIDLPGPCDESIRGVANFNASAYLGRWIEIERYPQPDQFGTCDRAYYSLGDGNVLVRNTQVIGQNLAEQLGFAEVVSTDNTGLLNVTFVVNGNTVIANYYILATDYENYALVYSCTNLPNDRRIVYSWKLSRTTYLSTPAISAINTVINQTQGLSQDYYQATNQTDEACFYVPEVNVNKAPIFRGQCHERVAAMTSFDAARYAGWWHEIERYPVDNHRGECISSQYQTSGNSFLVTDTVVANGSATVTSGTVQVTADGRLRRTINGVTEDVWVLATDYETYSLLYSCQNLEGNEYRRVWSAKHSKARTLTTAAQAAMEPVIAYNQLLYPQFYLSVDQSAEACFHYPAVTGQHVILPGQCDENIPVVQNFDLEAYGGTWYQIERYPQIHEIPTGTCVGARYTLQDSGIVTVLNWEVIDGELMTIEGNATLIYSDGSAKLNVVLPVRGSTTGETVNTTLYVLTTDYEKFSLAYSCSNVNAFQRRIGAWKLSRERTLAPVHSTAINTYMANREELHQPFFVTVEQDEDCEEPSSGALVRSSIVVMLICALWQILS